MVRVPDGGRRRSHHENKQFRPQVCIATAACCNMPRLWPHANFSCCVHKGETAPLRARSDSAPSLRGDLTVGPSPAGVDFAAV